MKGRRLDIAQAHVPVRNTAHYQPTVTVQFDVRIRINLDPFLRNGQEYISFNPLRSVLEARHTFDTHKL